MLGPSCDKSIWVRHIYTYPHVRVERVSFIIARYLDVYYFITTTDYTRVQQPCVICLIIFSNNFGSKRDPTRQWNFFRAPNRGRLITSTIDFSYGLMEQRAKIKWNFKSQVSKDGYEHPSEGT